jgi:hypothetical protein
MSRSSLTTNASHFHYLVFILAAAVLSLFSSLYAKNISGDIGGVTLTADKGPYIVEKDCTVPKGKTAIIEKGCRFFFNPFTGIIVEGNLTVAGTKDQPVLFTSINDTFSTGKEHQQSDAFDWNGILISKESGTVLLKNFHLQFSTHGIKSQKPNIKIENGMFSKNGQFHFTINDKIQKVDENTPYSYSVYTVSYLPNGATSGQPPADLSYYRVGDTVMVAENTGKLEKNNYEFSGWYASSDGNKKACQPLTVYIMGNSDIKFSALWRRNPIDTKHELITKGVPAGISIAGAASGAISVYYLNRWLDGRDEYGTTFNSDRRSALGNEGRQNSAISISACAGSVAAFATAATLYWWWNIRDDGKRAAALIPIAAPGGAGVALSVNIR